MEAKEIGAIVDSMHEDELDVLSQLLTLSDPERSDAMILREDGRGPSVPDADAPCRETGQTGTASRIVATNI